MAFRFSLAMLLRFRQTLERQAEILLQEANQQVAGLLHAIEEADRALAQVGAGEARALQSGVSAAELQFDLLRRDVLLCRRKELVAELARAQQVQLQRRREFQRARQRREVVDTLRQHQLERYREEEGRREQRRLDDLFLLRREFLKRG
jgi:flagellar export protein FliJ